MTFIQHMFLGAEYQDYQGIRMFLGSEYQGIRVDHNRKTQLT